MFCANCGKEVADGLRFCTNCGTPVTAQQQAAVPPQTPQYTPPPSGDSGGNSTLLLDYKLVTGFANANFNYVDAYGKTISAEKLFYGAKAAVNAQIALLGLYSQGFGIKIDVYDNKICFTRLSLGGLGKPTNDKFEINGSEIASVEMSNTFLDKSITIVTHSRGKVNFPVPKKHIERIAEILNGMIRQNKS